MNDFLAYSASVLVASDVLYFHASFNTSWEFYIPETVIVLVEYLSFDFCIAVYTAVRKK